MSDDNVKAAQMIMIVENDRTFSLIERNQICGHNELTLARPFAMPINSVLLSGKSSVNCKLAIKMAKPNDR